VTIVALSPLLQVVDGDDGAGAELVDGAGLFFIKISVRGTMQGFRQHWCQRSCRQSRRASSAALTPGAPRAPRTSTGGFLPGSSPTDLKKEQKNTNKIIIFKGKKTVRQKNTKGFFFFSP
jgi:hypothetical protein